MARQFRDMKQDTQVAYIASAFLLANPEVGNESLPYHVHSLSSHEAGKEISKYPSPADIDWSRKFTTTADFSSKVSR
jgi:hypothetical protein